MRLGDISSASKDVSGAVLEGTESDADMQAHEGRPNGKLGTTWRSRALEENVFSRSSSTLPLEDRWIANCSKHQAAARYKGPDLAC